MFKTRIRDRDYTKTALFAAVALLLGLLALTFKQAADVRTLSTRLNGIYQKAFYETCELMEGMSTDLRKLLVTGSAQQQQILLSDISRQAQGAQDNLAALPLGEGLVAATIKFVNQAGDFSTSLSGRLAGGGAVSDDDYAILSTLSTTAAELAVGLGQLLQRYEAGENVFAGDLTTNGASAESGLESLYPLTNPASAYPVLLYDGPFSDGATQPEFRALSGLAEVAQADAERALRAFIGNESVTELTFDGESAIPIACYEYSLTAGGYNLSAGVTKAGGKILYVLPNDDVTEVRLTDAQAVDAAHAFLISRGYGEMQESYFSRYDGILTINFASVKDGVVLYPDLVKVQVSLENGAIIGVEARGYLSNHVERTLTLPAVSEMDAIARLGDRLTATSSRLCVIPENANEYLCYEIAASDGADSFLIYVDAMTGAEREILQVVSDETGVLVM